MAKFHVTLEMQKLQKVLRRRLTMAKKKCDTDTAGIAPVELRSRRILAASIFSEICVTFC